MGQNRIMLSIYATKNIYCINDPIELKILFENVSDQDVLLIDPETWQISSLFFYIKNASEHKIYAEPRKIRNVFADPDIKLVLLKSGAQIEFCYPDIKSQYFDEYQYKMDKEGLYYVSARYNPGRVFRTKKGMISYRGKITSNEIEIQLKKCTR